VVTLVGGLPEVVVHEKTGYLVEPQNPEAIAGAVINYFQENKEKCFARNIKSENRNTHGTAWLML